MRLSDQFVDPSSYGRYNFSGIPGTILSALTPEVPESSLPEDALGGFKKKYEKVVLFLVDGLGLDAFKEMLAKSKHLESLCSRGSAIRLATQFPSTTACNITTMSTALGVARHGIYEWFYYEPKAGEIIAPLLYSFGPNIKERDSLKANEDIRPEDIYPCQTIYEMLKAHGVKSYAFQDKEYAFSPYTNVVFNGAWRYGYMTLADGLANLAGSVLEEPGKAYYYFYFDKLDSLSHVYGPSSKEMYAELDAFLILMERIFLDRVKDAASSTLFILTADHGQTAIDPGKCVYLNLAFPEIVEYTKKSRSGRFLAPAGSCRDMFLYIKEDRVDDALRLLEDGLRDKALVVKTETLIENGYFGEKHISEELAGRLGNIAVLPYEGHSVWWYEKNLFEIKFFGHHGGLTRQEMEIPFLAWEL